MNTEIAFLASVFQKANRLTRKPVRAEFLEHFKLEIERTCNTLKFLGLVEEARSTLGFKPTPRLIDIVVDRMVRANTAGNNPAAMIEADCFGWLWHHVTSDLGSEQPGRDEQDDEGEQHEDTAEDVVKEDDGPDEYWDAEDDYQEAEDDGSGRQFCCKVFVLLGLLRPGHKRYVSTRLMTDLVLDRCFQQLSKKGLNVI